MNWGLRWMVLVVGALVMGCTPLALPERFACEADADCEAPQVCLIVAPSALQCGRSTGVPRSETLGVCGDAIVDPLESCDDGLDGSGWCSRECEQIPCAPYRLLLDASACARAEVPWPDEESFVVRVEARLVDTAVGGLLAVWESADGSASWQLRYEGPDADGERANLLWRETSGNAEWAAEASAALVDGVIDVKLERVANTLVWDLGEAPLPRAIIGNANGTFSLGCGGVSAAYDEIMLGTTAEALRISFDQPGQIGWSENRGNLGEHLLWGGPGRYERADGRQQCGRSDCLPGRLAIGPGVGAVWTQPSQPDWRPDGLTIEMRLSISSDSFERNGLVIGFEGASTAEDVLAQGRIEAIADTQDTALLRWVEPHGVDEEVSVLSPPIPLREPVKIAWVRESLQGGTTRVRWFVGDVQETTLLVASARPDFGADVAWRLGTEAAGWYLTVDALRVTATAVYGEADPPETGALRAFPGTVALMPIDDVGVLLDASPLALQVELVDGVINRDSSFHGCPLDER